MKILAIETSCDDTGVAALEANNGKFKVLSNVVASQIEVHKKYGGVYPALAKREHQKNLPVVLEKALEKAKILNPQKEIDLIAVTNGPGLEPCLWVGVNFAKNLSHSWSVPVVTANHIEAHILVNFLNNKDIKFPALVLVVSGGHTQLILMRKLGDYEILGETRDDAAGECFDKCAKILGLGYPGGPIIAAAAAKSDIRYQISDIRLPRPMMYTKDYDFSFSGLKTAVLYYFQKNPKVNKNQFAAEIQQVIIDVLIKKTIKAAKDFRVKSIILGGGVSANDELRRQFELKIENCKLKIDFLVPPKNLSTDNALMVAIAGYFRAKQKKFIKPQDLEAKANLRVE